MKKIIYTIIAVAATAGSITLTSCENQLDIIQKGVTKNGNTNNTDESANQALAAAYESFMCNVMGRQPELGGPDNYTPYKIVTNMCGDDVYSAGRYYGDQEFACALNEFRYDAYSEALRHLYNGLYRSVYHCNLVICNFENGDTPYQRRAVAEARVLRAYDYFMLSLIWGNPPLITTPIKVNEHPSNSDKNQMQYFQWVAAECEAALDDLTERESQSDKNGAVIVTKGFAYALAGKAYLFAKDYEQAKTALKKVIDSNKYALVPGDRYWENFHIQGDGNEEKVFELNIERTSEKAAWDGMIQHSTWKEANSWNWLSRNFKTNPANYYNSIDGWGGLGVPLWFGRAFHENDGDSRRFKASLIHIVDAVCLTDYAPIEETEDTEEKASAKLVETLGHMNISSDEIESIKHYFKTKIITDKDKGNQYCVSLDYNDIPIDYLKYSHLVGISDTDQGLYGNSFYIQIKQLMRDSDTDGKAYGNNVRLNNYIVMRYAEVLLNYAEACLHTGNISEAKKYINQIQARAGSATVSNMIDMETLKREKMFELWTEGCRFFDIIRWNDAECIDRLESAGHAVIHLFDKLFRSPRADDEGIIWAHGSEANSRFYIVSSNAAMDANNSVGFKKGKHELFPFPQHEIDMNPNLVQNPGW